MTLTILADENIPAVEHYAGASATVRRFSGRKLEPAHLEGVDALLVRSVTAVDAALLDNSDIRFVGTATSGVDHIDQQYLKHRGIAFSHAPGSNANSVVEYVLAAIAAVDDYLERVLAGAPVGIIGYGIIGKAVAGRLQALNIKCRAYDPWLAPGAIEHPAALREILASSVITLHAELTRAQPWPSYHLIDAAALSSIASDALLINASRGAVLDNAALLALLERGSGPTVVLDVWEGEPEISAALLRQVRLGTPHIAGYSFDGKLLATRMLVAAMTRALNLPGLVPASAAGEAAALDLGDHDSDAALIRHLINQRYDIRADDAALRAAVLGTDIVQDIDGREAALAFDQLRRNYPQRRELLGSRVASGPCSDDVQAIIKGLGGVLAAGQS